MIYIIVGTKAQLIKMAPVMVSLSEHKLEYRYISTGQHNETMQDITDNFGLSGPDYVLYNGPDITSIPQMIIWGTKILWNTFRQKESILGNNHGKGVVLVHGDTFSTLLGAIMGRIFKLKVGHVESGLRSFNIFHPFPEEITRLLTFRLSDYYFCPGDWAVQNLNSYSGEKINTISNTLKDALQRATLAINSSEVDIPAIPYAVATIHRFENIYSRQHMERIISVIEKISLKKHVIFILHKPTENKLYQFGLYDRLASLNSVEIRPRYDYFKFIKLISRADFVVSDGGSNQEECFYMGKPVLLLRKATERPEGIGKNCVLSEYREDKINHFLENYSSLARLGANDDISPSKIISLFLMENDGKK